MASRSVTALLLALLGVAASPGRPTAQPTAHTPSPEARALYERARAALPNRDALQDLLDQAIAADPDYAAAYALKAENFAQAIAATVARSTDLSLAQDLDRKAVANANKAIELDPSLAQAYTALGLAHRQFWRWPEALAAYKRAYELTPKDPAALTNWIWFNAFTGRFDEAIAAAHRQVQLYPERPNAYRDLGIAEAYAEQPEPASEALQECMTKDPKITICHIYYAFMQIRLDHDDAAAKELETAESLFGASPTPAAISSVAHGYFRAGQRDDARRLFARLETEESSGVVGAGSWPLGYLAIADEAQAYRWLDRAVKKIERHEPDEGVFNLMIIKANVVANPVLEEQRFRALRERIGAL